MPPRHSPRRVSVPKLEGEMLTALGVESEEQLARLIAEQERCYAAVPAAAAARAAAPAAPPTPPSEDTQSGAPRDRSDSYGSLP